MAIGRLLRKEHPSDADRVWDLILEQQPTGSDAESTAQTLAARAEALALKSRYREAREQYRQAIELAGPGATRRSWWFNLADIASRLDESIEREAALRAAIATTPGDDIARRVASVRRGATAPSFGRSSGTKAN